MNNILPCRHCGKVPTQAGECTAYGFEMMLKCDCFELMGLDDWVVKEWNRLNKQEDEDGTN